MCPWLARAQYDARAGSTPSTRLRKSATSSGDGVVSVTSRQRERIVGRRSSTVGAHSIHTVRSVGRGLDAVQAAASWQPDVALVDIGLPDIDGYEVARRIRALDLPARPRLVAITGFGQPDDQRTAYEAGFDLHLTKPVAPEFLRDVMQALTARQPTAKG